MADAHWYVRIYDDKIGPMSERELHDLARRGGLKSDSLVSQDGVQWRLASSLPELQFGTAVPLIRSSSGASGNFGLVIALLSAGALIALMVAIFVVARVALVPERQTHNQYSQAEAAYPSSVADLTFAYWQQVQSLTSQLNDPKHTAESFPVACRNIAVGIYSLPAQSVDQEAVQCVHEVATVLGYLADFIERSNSPDLLVEAFLRGAAGDLLGPTIEHMESQKIVLQQVQYVTGESQRVRAILSARYGAEFPPL